MIGVIVIHKVENSVLWERLGVYNVATKIEKGISENGYRKNYETDL